MLEATDLMVFYENMLALMRQLIINMDPPDHIK